MAGIVDGVKHTANADGSHTIVITVPAHVVDKSSLPEPPDTTKLQWGGGVSTGHLMPPKKL
jgi:hypothetical protein